MFRLAHISDVHLGPLPPVLARELMSKRITGYINWHRNRATHHSAENLARLLTDMARRRPDHLAVTGDLVNLALDAEIETARAWLASLGDPRDVTLVCGNHDAYVAGALAKALASWQPWVAGDDARAIDGPEDFPVLRRRGSVSLVSCNSARASMPFLATGYFRRRQAVALADMLAQEGRLGQCRVVLIHHPPTRFATSLQKRLIGASQFRAAIRQSGAELVLHGHTHLASVGSIAGPDRPVPVVGVPSAVESGKRHRPAARYNLFAIAEGPRGWSIAMQEYGIAGEAAPVELIAKRQLA